MSGPTAVIGWALLSFSLLGILYTVAAGLSVTWFFSRPPSLIPADLPPVTILKPLYGDEPYLRLCLDGFCLQDYPSPVQLIFGVRDENDPAIAVVKGLIRDNPDRDIALVVNGDLHGASFKVSNLLNMTKLARHPIIVAADSDISVGQSYLRQLVTALMRPGIGYATCIYRGVATGNYWSRFSVMAINYHFLPSVAFGIRVGLAKPCFGPTIAFRRSTLDEVGGFLPFANYLAEDFEIGRAIRELGYRFAVPPLLIGHGCPDRTGRNLLHHELRWARTIRMIDPLSYAGSAVCHPLPWALLAAVILHGLTASLAVVVLAACSRLFVILQVDRVAGGVNGGRWLSPLRDLVSGGVWLTAFFVRTVRWKGRRFRIGQGGVLVADSGAVAEAAS